MQSPATRIVLLKTTRRTPALYSKWLLFIPPAVAGFECPMTIHVATHLDEDAVRLLNWPNWLAVVLKKLYTPKEIIFGFVRKNVVERSIFGGVCFQLRRFMPLLSARAVVGYWDSRFFTGNEPMLQAMMQADDDDQDACRRRCPAKCQTSAANRLCERLVIFSVSSVGCTRSLAEQDSTG